jgi:metal-sulfur cluster biosynthetic enzyme
MAEDIAPDERASTETAGAAARAIAGANRPGTAETPSGSPGAPPSAPPSTGGPASPPAATAAAATVPADSDDGVTPDIVRSVLRKVKDPELNLNIIDLGLVYDIRVDGTAVSVDMSLTSPGCPSGPEIMGEAERQIAAMPGVSEVSINLVWSPFWSPDRIEPRVRAYLGI